jgi:hypothetical protein
MAKEHRRATREHAARQDSAPTSPETKALQPFGNESEDGKVGARIATVAAVGIAAALIEVDWIPGVLLGVAAMLAPNLLPRMGQGLRPLVKGAVRAGYSVAEKTRETVAEATEQIQDIVAEVRAEAEPAASAVAEPANEPEHA